jgi:hypothetical protein
MVAEHLSKAKEDFLREGQKAYIAINGAGAAGLLAFLQAIWGKPEAMTLVPYVLVGITAFTFGVAVASTSFMARHIAFVRGASDARHFWYQYPHRYVPIASIFLFCVGMLSPVMGAAVYWFCR